MQTPQIIALTAPVEIQAAAGSSAPSFEVRAYNGGPLPIAGWPKPVVVDLAHLDQRPVLVANLDHDTTKRVGNFTVENDGQSLVARGTASAATAARDEVVNSAKQGFIWQASIEVHPTKTQDIAKGQTIQVNGQSIAGPVILAEGTLAGFAFVSHGADPRTAVSIAARLQQQGIENASPELLAFIEEVMPGRNVEDLRADELESICANFNGRTSPNRADRQQVAPLIFATGDSVEAENHRVAQIERLCAGDFGDLSERVNELKAEAIGSGLPADSYIERMQKIRQEKIMSTIPKGHTVHAPSSGHSGNVASGSVMEAAVCLQANLKDIDKHFDERTLDAAQKIQGSIGYAALFGSAMPGLFAPGEKISQQKLIQGLYGFAPAAAVQAANFSTLSLPTVFSNISNKFLKAGWMSVDRTCLRLAAIRPVDNFREVKTVSLVGSMEFEAVGPDGELAHGSLGETVYSNKADTYGILFSITRTDIINDDLGALTSVPRRIGRGAMLKLNKIFWAAFLDNASFFSSANNNVSTVHGLLSVAGLEAAETLFINQVDPDGEPLGTVPAILLAPPAYKATALTLMTSQGLVGGSALAPNANVWQQRFRVESSPYMQNAAFTGYSDKAWYLLADPNDLPVIEIAALNGRVEPFVETASADFSSLGVQMRGYSDIGVRLQEVRGGIRADGLAA